MFPGSAAFAPAAAALDGSSTIPGKTTNTGSIVGHYAQLLSGVAVLYALDHALKAVLLSQGIKFPASLVCLPPTCIPKLTLASNSKVQASLRFAVRLSGPVHALKAA